MLKKAIFALTIIAALCIPYAVPAVHADETGSSVVAIEPQISIGGTRVKSDSDVIIATAQRPVFFGYTLQNVRVELFSDAVSIGTANTDSTGYWKFSPKQNLLPGVRVITMQLTDETGASAPVSKVASLKIPTEDIKPVYGITIPSVPLSKLNYVTVSLLVITGSAIVAAVYLLTKKHNKHEADK